jgi:hypothetical protein
VNGKGETIKTMGYRAGWDATFSAPKSVSLTALVGGDDDVRRAHRESVKLTLDELEKYVQARIGGSYPPETTGKWVAACFEHDSARPVNGYGLRNSILMSSSSTSLKRRKARLGLYSRMSFTVPSSAAPQSIALN